MEYYEGKIPKALVEECGMVFNNNAVILFQKTGDQDAYTLHSLLQKWNQDEVFHNYTENVSVTSEARNGDLFRSRESFEKGGSRLNRLRGAVI